MPGWEITVSGRVQGVGFRWFVLDCALRHGIKGYVKNMPDGTVQLVAVGNQADIDLFLPEIRQGNRHSVVSNMTVEALAHYADYEEFVIA
jgi:acylphosphatase